jgi:hypothetical protein
MKTHPRLSKTIWGRHKTIAFPTPTPQKANGRSCRAKRKLSASKFPARHCNGSLIAFTAIKKAALDPTNWSFGRESERRYILTSAPPELEMIVAHPATRPAHIG